jgi:hypothetical protein
MRTYRAPANVARVALEALEDRRKYHRGGTSVGRARALVLGFRQPMTRYELAVMAAWFARHDHLAPYRRTRSSAASISWRLWGGDACRAWLRRLGVR